LVVKLIELLGTSSKSWEDAVELAVTKAGESLKNIHAVDVLSFNAKIKNGKISEYRANIKVAFAIE